MSDLSYSRTSRARTNLDVKQVENISSEDEEPCEVDELEPSSQAKPSPQKAPAKNKNRNLLFNPAYHTYLEPACKHCSKFKYDCFKVITPSAFEKKFKCMRCRDDRRVCSLSPSDNDNNLSAGLLISTTASSFKATAQEAVSKTSSKRKSAALIPEPAVYPKPKMKRSSGLESQAITETKTSSKRRATSSPEPEVRPQPKMKVSLSESSQLFPTAAPMTNTTFSSTRLDLEDLRSQVRILSHRLTEVEEFRVRERAAYGHSLEDLSCRIEILERSGSGNKKAADGKRSRD